VRDVIAGIKAALVETGRTIEEDHYGAAFGFRFGGPDDPGVATVMAGYQARTGRDPRTMFAIGDAAVITERLRAYVDAGASKFILRPVAQGDADMLAQTRRLVEEVLPLVAAEWPRPRKAAA
jgi:hypothetical protein